MISFETVRNWQSLDDSDGFDGGSGLDFARGRLPEVQGSFIFKRYQDKNGTTPDWDALGAVVDWSRDCPAGLRKRCALPRDIVEQDGVPVGIVMPEASASFYRTTRTGRVVPNSGDYLGSRVDDEPAQVWAGLGDLLQTTLMLHRHNVWVVDLHPRNYLVRTDRPANAIDPITLLLDCDGLAVDGKTFLDIQPEDYWGPQGKRLQPSAERDLYCFALATVKTVGNDHSISPPTQAPPFVADALGVYTPIFDKWLNLAPMTESEANLAQMLAKVLRACRGPVRDRVPVGGNAVLISQVPTRPKAVATAPSGPATPVATPRQSPPVTQPQKPQIPAGNNTGILVVIAVLGFFAFVLFLLFFVF